MMLKREISHPLLGKIIVTYNKRARKIIMRARFDAIYITAPTLATDKDIERALATYGERLKQQQENLPQNRIDANYSIATQHLKLNLREGDIKGVKITGNNGTYTIFYEKNIDFGRDETQNLLQKATTVVLQHRAKQILPQRLLQLSKEHNMHYSRVTTRNCRTRWGSCSSSGSISLSIYLVLLPQHLIDYVLRHELCHTIEMNHSTRFWALLDKMCGTSSKALRQELRKFSTSI